MRQVKSKDTGPEMLVRRTVHGMGYRYRLHRKDLPGTPDIVFPRRKKVIFVHGCFWHGHTCKRGNRLPKTNQEYWKPKIEGNKQRDKKNEESLRNMGWDVMTIWECEVKEETLADRISTFLKG